MPRGHKTLSFTADPEFVQRLDAVAKKMSTDPAYRVASWGGRITRSQAIRILLNEAMVKHGGIQAELEL